MPEIDLPGDIRDVYQDMWANNGDAISRQYAGTAAMKVRKIYTQLLYYCEFVINL